MNRIEAMKELAYVTKRMADAETAMLKDCDQYFNNPSQCEKCYQKMVDEKLDLCNIRPHFLKYLDENGDRNQKTREEIVKDVAVRVDDFDVMKELVKPDSLDIVRFDSKTVKLRLGINMQDLSFKVPAEIIAAAGNDEMGFLCYGINKKAYQDTIEKLTGKVACIS